MRHLIYCIFILLGGSLRADSTISPVNRFAYSGNAGWLNFRPDQPSSPNGVVFGEYVLSGQAHASNFGWLDFGDGTPANGIRYQNNAATDFGVNHDGAGNLSGYAHGANIGWVNFGWATAADANRPRVNLLTGAFSGYAYGANIGWIDLGTGFLTTVAMRSPDGDGDGIADAWELDNFGNFTTATATSNADGDAARDRDEYLAGTAPGNAADHLRISSHAYNAGATSATVVFTTVPTRLYRLETCNTLGVTPFVDSGLGTFAPDPGATTTRVISWPGTARKLIRAVVVRPLTP